MIEIVYREEKQEANGNESYFYLPKNIRQIGDGKGSHKIYVEDYVYTYLRRLTSDTEEGKVAILLGQYNWADGISYLFIRSALAVHKMEPAPDNLKFDDQVWSEVHDTMEKYFRGQTILGWALSLPGYQEEPNEVMLKAHLNHFGGNDKTFLRIDPLEKEETFYLYEGNILKKVGGFHVFYEKNEPMQTYMIDENENRSIENSETVADRAVTDFRKLVVEKQEARENGERKPFAYAVTACAAAVLLMAVIQKYTGILPIGDYHTVTASATAEGERRAEDSVLDKAEENAGEKDSKIIDAKSDPDGRNLTESDSKETAEMTDQESADTELNETETKEAEEETKTAETSPEKEEPADETSAVVWQEYVVQKGDSLSRISERYYGTMGRVKDICALNGIASEDLIYAGQKILLPK
ncbi:MAG: LysM peptidoglycan-binding domain-containing protein [Fusicatenibacter sp.]|nr:LysM peptidoglycan-binding domain-containing protein [Fusicatenibacter sp.]